MQRQTQLPQSVGDPREHLVGPGFADAVHDSVVGITLEHHVRVRAGQPLIERVVHEQVRQHR